MYEEVAEALSIAFIREGKLTEETMEETRKKLDLAEEFLKEIYPNGCPSYHDSKLGLLDLTFFSYFGSSGNVEELFGVKCLTEERYPLLTSWIKAISEVPEVKEVQPPKAKLLEHLRVVLEKLLPPKA